MALRKEELLFKKIFAKKAITENSTDRPFYSEPYTAPISSYSADIWTEMDKLPVVAPSLWVASGSYTAGDILYYGTSANTMWPCYKAKTTHSGVATVPGSDSTNWETFVALEYANEIQMVVIAGAPYGYYDVELKDTVPFSFGTSGYGYVLKKSGGDQIPFGENNWTFDTEAGTIYFNDDTNPASIGTPKMSCFVYKGKKLDNQLTTDNIGLNVPYPQEALDIDGSINLYNNKYLKWGNTNDDSIIVNNSAMYLNTAGTARLSISAAGTGTFSNDVQILGNLSLTDTNINNVADISLDTISSDGSTIVVNLDDDVANAFEIKEGSNTVMSVTTTNSGEKVDFDVGYEVVINGDLTVLGTETIINTATLEVEDAEIVIGNVASPTDVTADLGGLRLKGATDKTILWTNSTDSWHYNQGIRLLTDNPLSFRDGDLKIYSSTDGQLDMDVDGELEIVAPILDVTSTTRVDLVTDVVNIGADTTADVTLNFKGLNYDGLMKWMDGENYFAFMDDIFINSAENLYFRDTDLKINSSGDGQLDIDADGEIEIDAPVVDIDCSTKLDIDTPVIQVSQDIDIEGDIDMATGKYITWVDDDTRISGTADTLDLYSDGTMILNADTKLDLNSAVHIDIDTPLLTMNGATSANIIYPLIALSGTDEVYVVTPLFNVDATLMDVDATNMSMNGTIGTIDFITLLTLASNTLVAIDGGADVTITATDEIALTTATMTLNATDLDITASSEVDINSPTINLDTQQTNVNLKDSQVNALSFETDMLSFDTDEDRVGMFTTSPEEDFHLVGDMKMTNGSPSIYFEDTTASAENWEIKVNGDTLTIMNDTVGENVIETKYNPSETTLKVYQDTDAASGDGQPIAYFHNKRTGASVTGTGIRLRDQITGTGATDNSSYWVVKETSDGETVTGIGSGNVETDQHLSLNVNNTGRVGIRNEEPANHGWLSFGSSSNNITMNSDDAADNMLLAIAGGGTSGTNRGGTITLGGNEHAGYPGCINMLAGNIIGGRIGMSVQDDEILGIEYDKTLNIDTTTSDTNITSQNVNLYASNSVNIDTPTIDLDTQQTNIDLKDSQINALCFETDMLTFDTASKRLGVNTTVPFYGVDVNEKLLGFDALDASSTTAGMIWHDGGTEEISITRSSVGRSDLDIGMRNAAGTMDRRFTFSTDPVASASDDSKSAVFDINAGSVVQRESTLSFSKGGGTYWGITAFAANNNFHIHDIANDKAILEMYSSNGDLKLNQDEAELRLFTDDNIIWGTTGELTIENLIDGGDIYIKSNNVTGKIAQLTLGNSAGMGGSIKGIGHQVIFENTLDSGWCEVGNKFNACDRFYVTGSENLGDMNNNALEDAEIDGNPPARDFANAWTTNTKAVNTGSIREQDSNSTLILSGAEVVVYHLDYKSDSYVNSLEESIEHMPTDPKDNESRERNDSDCRFNYSTLGFIDQVHQVPKRLSIYSDVLYKSGSYEDWYDGGLH